MRKLLITTCCILAGCFLLTGIILPTMKNQKTMAQTTSIVESVPQPSSTTDSSTQSAPVSSYLVKEYNGKIAVFREGESTPFRITDVSVNTLPYADQVDLKDGIHASDDVKLVQLLEDLCS